MSSPTIQPQAPQHPPPAALIIGSAGSVGAPLASAFKSARWSTICVDPAEAGDGPGRPGRSTNTGDRFARRRSSSASRARAKPRVAGRMRRGTGSERFRAGSLGPGDASMKGASDLIKEAFGDLVGDDFDFDGLSDSSSGSDSEEEDDEAKHGEAAAAAAAAGPEPKHLSKPKFFEEITPDELMSYIASPSSSRPDVDGGWGVREIVYCAEEGNRDAYADRPSTGAENDERFANFIEALARALEDLGTEIFEKVHVSYVGGSWTRRAMDASTHAIADGSPAKEGGGSNPYELAKTSAAENARSLAEAYRDLLSVTFYDYVSVVPNYAPNFTMFQMVKSALEEGVVRYSPGEEYGRALLHGAQAGEIVAKMAARRLEERRAREEKNSGGAEGDAATVPPEFETVLVPGAFTPFSTYAAIARNVVLQSGAQDVVDLVPLEEGATPDSLKATCVSERLRDEIGFEPDEWMVGEGLMDAAGRALRDLVGARAMAGGANGKC